MHTVHKNYGRASVRLRKPYYCHVLPFPINNVRRKRRLTKTDPQIIITNMSNRVNQVDNSRCLLSHPFIFYIYMQLYNSVIYRPNTEHPTN